MTAKWTEYKLSDITDIVGGGTPNTGNSAFWGGDIPWLSVVDFNTGRKYVTETEKSITKEGLDKSSTRILDKNDIIISARGTVGVIAMLASPMAFNQSCYGLKPRTEIITNQYLYYLLKNTVHELSSYTYGAVFDTITKDTFEHVIVSIPPLPEQQSIAEVLSSLDDKIDLLHRNNKTLEQLAETLFRQWFVEEAKEDWEEGTISDLFILQRGYDLPVQNRRTGEYPIITSSGFNDSHSEFKVNGPGVVTGRSGVIGNVFYVRDNFWPLNTTLFISEYKRATPLYAYFFLKTLELNSLNAGSAVPTLNRNHVHIIKTSIPPVDIIQRFETMATAYFDKIYYNRKQIETLTTVRDTLLPKLMNGEVRVEI